MHRITQLDSFDMDIDYRALCENLARGNMENTMEEFKKMVKDWVDSVCTRPNRQGICL